MIEALNNAIKNLIDCNRADVNNRQLIKDEIIKRQTPQGREISLYLNRLLLEYPHYRRLEWNGSTSTCGTYKIIYNTTVQYRCECNKEILQDGLGSYMQGKLFADIHKLKLTYGLEG
jgi:hypothetical protein